MKEPCARQSLALTERAVAYVCPDCKGSGSPGEHLLVFNGKCPLCEGAGIIWAQSHDISDGRAVCARCRGSGGWLRKAEGYAGKYVTEFDKCPACDGSGFVTLDHKGVST